MTMKRRELLRTAALSGVCLAGFPFDRALAQLNPKQRDKKQRVLFFTRNVGYEHSVVHRVGDKLSYAEHQMTKLLGEAGIDIVCEKDGRVFDADIEQYDAFLFYCNNDLTTKNKRNTPPMTKTGLKRLLTAISNGTGFMGFHSTCACWRTPGEKNQNHPDKVSPFLKMLGGEFIAHGIQQKAALHLVSPKFPGTEKLGRYFRLHEEFYGLKNFSEDMHVILTQETKGMKGGVYDRPPYPSTWAKEHNKGRVFYTALGHREDVWMNEHFQQLVLGGLSWILKNVDADIKPNIKIVTPQASVLQNSQRQQAKNKFSWQQTENDLALMHGNQILWRFNFGPKETKPFFDPISLPGTDNLTWKSPPDHPWHYGLWFSWKLMNGVNYWEENRNTGLPDGRTSWKVLSIKPKKDLSARIEIELSYHPPKQQAVLKETRVIEISAPNASGEYQIDWQAKFTSQDKPVTLDRTPLPNEPNGKIYGGYAGLSVRMAKDASQFEAIDCEGKIEKQKNKPQKTRLRFKSLAVDNAGLLNGSASGIAILDHPKNHASPSPWYVIRDVKTPMTFFNPALIHDAPMTIAAGKTFNLQYRILVHRGQFDASALKQRSKQFIAGAK